MRRGGWHIHEAAGVWTLARRWPARFDLSAEVVLPGVTPKRLMHQIRQDVWRALQKLRGFQPAVRLEPYACEWKVTAGGAVDGHFAPAHVAQLHEVLACPARQARWCRFAGYARTLRGDS